MIRRETQELAKSLLRNGYDNSREVFARFVAAWDGPKTPLEKAMVDEFIRANKGNRLRYPGDLVYDFLLCSPGVDWGVSNVEGCGTHFGDKDVIRGYVQQVYKLTATGLQLV